jgi:hypothetical protein
VTDRANNKGILLRQGESSVVERSGEGRVSGGDEGADDGTGRLRRWRRGKKEGGGCGKSTAEGGWCHGQAGVDGLREQSVTGNPSPVRKG